MPVSASNWIMGYDSDMGQAILIGGWNPTTGYSDTILSGPSWSTWDKSMSMGFGYTLPDIPATTQSYTQTTNYQDDRIYAIIRNSTFFSYPTNVNWTPHQGSYPALGTQIPQVLDNSCLTSYRPRNYAWDNLLVVGGNNGYSYSTSVLMYDIQNNVWITGPNMIRPRTIFSCIVHNEYLYVIGGITASDVMTSKVERIGVRNIESQSWTEIGDLSQPLAYSRAVVFEDNIYVIGGYNSITALLTDNVEVIDTLTDTISIHSHLLYPVSSVGAVVGNNIIYVMGGYVDVNQVTNQWQYYTIPTPYPTPAPTTSEPTRPPTYAPTRRPTNLPTSVTSYPSLHPTKAPISVLMDGFEISYTCNGLLDTKWINEGTLNVDIHPFSGGAIGEILTNGKSSNALCFDTHSTTFIDYDTNSAVRPELSMEIWIYPTETSQTWLLGHDDGGYDRSIIVYDTRFNGLALGIGEEYTSNVDNPPLNQWTHIVATYSKSGGTATLYKNGGTVVGGEQQTISIITDGGGLTRIGLNDAESHNSHYFIGCIGQVQMVNRILSETEIQTLYTNFMTSIDAGCSRLCALNSWIGCEWKTAATSMPLTLSNLVMGYESNSNQIWMIGGWNAIQGPQNNLINYDISTDTFTLSTLPIHIPSSTQSFTQINDVMYMIVGNTSFATFNMVSQEFVYPSSIDPIPSIMDNSCLANIDSTHLVVLGGNNGYQYYNTMYIYDLENAVWMNGTNMTQTRTLFTCNVHNEHLYAIGGITGWDYTNGVPYYTAEIEKISTQNMESESWLVIGELSQPIAYTRSVIFGDYIFVIGGYESNLWLLTDNVEIIDTINDMITVHSTLNYAVSSVGAISTDKSIYAMGGYVDTSLTTNEWQYYTTIQPTPLPTIAPTTDPTKDPTNVPTMPPYEISYICDGLLNTKWVNDGTLSNVDITPFLGGAVGEVVTDGTPYNALCFDTDATTFIDYNTNSAVRPELSMEIWIYPKGRERTWLLSHDNGGYDRAIIVYDPRYDGLAVGTGVVYTSSVDNPPLNQWTHIVVTYSKSGNLVTLYKNGGTDVGGEQQTMGIVADGGGYTRIGLNDAELHNGHYFIGCIGQVQIVDRILTDNEIEMLYNDFIASIDAGCTGSNNVNDIDSAPRPSYLFVVLFVIIIML